ncbi:MAG: hypothetical protein V4686_01230 [Patescibacteria group bacterium]
MNPPTFTVGDTVFLDTANNDPDEVMFAFTRCATHGNGPFTVTEIGLTAPDGTVAITISGVPINENPEMAIDPEIAEKCSKEMEPGTMVLNSSFLTHIPPPPVVDPSHGVH